MNIHDDPTKSEETRRLLQAAIESANDAIIITEIQLDSPGPRIEYVNPAFTRMTQYTQSEVIGQTPRILQGPKTDPGLIHRLRKDLETIQSFHGETTNYRKDGTEYEVEWRITPVFDRLNKPTKWVAVQRDVTDRVRAEAIIKSSEKHLRALNQDLEQFVYAASHDLQEPIRNVTLHSQFLERSFPSALPESVREHLDYILEGSQRLGNLIRDLLIYARASHNDEPQPANDTELEQVIAAVRQDVNRLVAETGAIIECRGLHFAVELPETQLNQIYSNLITNAIKYRRPGIRPEIVLGASAEADPNWIRLWVQDNGQGVDPRYQKEVFGVFRRLNHHQDSSGTGIGLAIVQRIVEKHGGAVWVESDGRSGSTFYFTAPGRALVNAKANQHSAC